MNLFDAMLHVIREQSKFSRIHLRVDLKRKIIDIYEYKYLK